MVLICRPCIHHLPGEIQCRKSLIQIARTGCIFLEVKPKRPRLKPGQKVVDK